MRPHVLIVAPDFPPTNRSSSLRAYAFSQAFARRGYSVTVLAERPARGESGLPRPDGAVEVRRMRAPHRSVWLAWALLQVLRDRRRMPPTLVVSSSGPFLSHVVGAVAKAGAPASFWVADYRDLWASGSYYDAPGTTGILTRLRRRCERRVMRRANLLTTVSDGLRQNLARFHGRAVEVFHNGFEAGAVREHGARQDPPPRGIQLCHTGSLYADRFPVGFLDALPSPSGSHDAAVRVVLAGRADATVRRFLAAHPARRQVHCVGQLEREASYRLQRESDFCLVLEHAGASMQGVLTGKVFEYIGMRKPVIAFGVEPESELATLLRGTGLLAYCGADPSELRAMLDAAVAGAAAPVGDEAVIHHYDRAAIADRLAARVGECIGVRGPPV